MTHWTARSIAYRVNSSKARQSSNNWLTVCPAHKDVGPSLSMRDKRDGSVLFNCLAGCDFVSIVKALRELHGVDIPPVRGQFKATAVKPSKPAAPVKAEENEDDLWIYAPERAEEIAFEPAVLGPRRAKKVSQFWDWRTADGKLLFYTVRLDEEDGTKNIVPVTPRVHKNTQKLSWRQKGPDGLRPLFNQHNDTGQPIVLLVEGEKTAKAAIRFFKNQPVWVTTTLGGCKAPHLVDWSPVKGRKIVIPHDFDQAGLTYAATVTENCHQAGATESFLWTLRADEVVTKGRIALRTDKIPSGYDLADAEEENWTLPLLLNQTRPWHGPEILRWEATA